jgi:hypothetical protein
MMILSWEERMTRWMKLLAAGATVVAMACAGDALSPGEGGPSTTRGTNGGADTTRGADTTHGNGGPTSNGPVASVTLTPRTSSLALGYFGSLRVDLRDAAGATVIKKVAWRSSDPAVLNIASDTGVFYAKALGTAKIYATVDGRSDSATVTVVPAPPPPPPPPPVNPVAEFSMTIVAMGVLPGTDTSRVERVAGATVTLTRAGMNGDSLSNPVTVGSAVTDANGEAKFAKLTGGSYAIRVTPPAGSAYTESQTGIAPPQRSDITVHVQLRRR